MRGTVIKTVGFHIRLCVVIGVNERGNAVIAGCETGKAYASEIKMLRSILSRMERFERAPFIADKGYDAVDVIERIKRLGGIPAVGVKQTQRKGVSNDLRKESLEEWERCKKKRYRVEALFGAIKLKVGSGFNFVREDMACSCSSCFVEPLHVGGAFIVYSWCLGGGFLSFSLRGSLIHRVF